MLDVGDMTQQDSGSAEIPVYEAGIQYHVGTHCLFVSRGFLTTSVWPAAAARSIAFVVHPSCRFRCSHSTSGRQGGAKNNKSEGKCHMMYKSYDKKPAEKTHEREKKKKKRGFFGRRKKGNQTGTVYGRKFQVKCDDIKERRGVRAGEGRESVARCCCLLVCFLMF